MNRIYLRKDVIKYLAKHSGYSQAVCKEILNTFSNLLIDIVENGDRLQLYGIFDISSVYVDEHYRTDPRDNSIKVKVKPKFKIKINAGKTLKDASQKAINNITELDNITELEN